MTSSLSKESGSKYASLFLRISRSDVHLGLLILILCSSIASRIDDFTLIPFAIALINTNLFLLFAFFVIFHLICADYDNRRATIVDYGVFVLSLLSLNLVGKMGVTHDVGLVTAGLAVWFWRQRKSENARYIALVWFALSLNVLIAPLFFQVFKSFILVAEVDLIAYIWNLLGYNVWADGQLLTSASGVKLRMIGACSVFTNLSFGFLCYASVKAYNRQSFSFPDMLFVAVLIALLALGNAIRIGLMLPSYEAYVYWHHGSGETIFGAAQFITIIAISFSSVWVRRAI
jgi:hypothetical protein